MCNIASEVCLNTHDILQNFFFVFYNKFVIMIDDNLRVQ